MVRNNFRGLSVQTFPRRPDGVHLLGQDTQTGYAALLTRNGRYLLTS